MKILLDNGHGNDTPGKRSPIWSDGSQFFEWEFNRDIVKRIETRLKKTGLDVVILVPELIDISLSKRVERANSYYAVDKDTFLISIHSNAGGGTGWEVLTSIGQTKSDLLAIELFKAAKEIFPEVKFRTDLSDGDTDKEENFTIIKKTYCPAVLTENFFMDTESDCKLLMSEAGREKIADLHTKGILNYIVTHLQNQRV